MKVGIMTKWTPLYKMSYNDYWKNCEHKSFVQPDEKTLRSMCSRCEYWLGDQHDYDECNDCVNLAIFKELEYLEVKSWYNSWNDDRYMGQC